MSDKEPEPFYSPKYKAPPRRTNVQPGERLWEFRKGLVAWSAELRDRGEYGVEAQILRDGDLVYGQRFMTRADAIAEAEECRRRIEADTWPLAWDDVS